MSYRLRDSSGRGFASLDSSVHQLFEIVDNDGFAARPLQPGKDKSLEALALIRVFPPALQLIALTDHISLKPNNLYASRIEDVPAIEIDRSSPSHPSVYLRPDDVVFRETEVLFSVHVRSQNADRRHSHPSADQVQVNSSAPEPDDSHHHTQPARQSNIKDPLPIEVSMSVPASMQARSATPTPRSRGQTVEETPATGGRTVDALKFGGSKEPSQLQNSMPRESLPSSPFRQIQNYEESQEFGLLTHTGPSGAEEENETPDEEEFVRHALNLQPSLSDEAAFSTARADHEGDAVDETMLNGARSVKPGVDAPEQTSADPQGPSDPEDMKTDGEGDIKDVAMDNANGFDTSANAQDHNVEFETLSNADSRSSVRRQSLFGGDLDSTRLDERDTSSKDEQHEDAPEAHSPAKQSKKRKIVDTDRDEEGPRTKKRESTPDQVAVIIPAPKLPSADSPASTPLTSEKAKRVTRQSPSSSAPALKLMNDPVRGTKVAFSTSKIASTNKTVESFMKRQGLGIAKTIKKSKFNILIIGDPKCKTSKLLKSLLWGKSVVTEAWLERSSKDDNTYDPAEFAPEGLDQEAPRSNLFKGKTIIVTTKLRKEYDEGYKDIEELALLCGGMVKTHAQKADKSGTLSLVVLGSEQDDQQATDIMGQGIAVFNKDLFSTSIYRGILDLGSDEFRIKPPPEKGKKELEKNLTAKTKSKAKAKAK